ncbi:MAG: 50S ribosomal protein L25 [Candidatus Wallbacteria bacterium]|nr:50S ribosomal protein L25 [Candidatus Wallbacteria bacterium]
MADELSAEVRKEVSKRATKSLRERLMVPAILYGRDTEPTPLAVSEKALTLLVRAHGHSALCTLNVQINGGEPKKQLVIYRELRLNALTRRVEHVDFQAIRADEKVSIKVPLKALGTPKGVDLHAGVLILNTAEVEIKCLPDRIPDHLELDVHDLDIHGTLHLRDIKLGDGVELSDDPDKVAASCTYAGSKIVETVAVAVEGAEGAAAVPAAGAAAPAAAGAKGAAPAAAGKGGAPAAAKGAEKAAGKGAEKTADKGAKK